MNKTMLRVVRVDSLGSPSPRIALVRRITGPSPTPDANLRFGYEVGSIRVEQAVEHHNDLVSLRVSGDVGVLRKGTLLHA